MGIAAVISTTVFVSKNFRQLEEGRVWRDTLRESVLFSVTYGFAVGLLLSIVGPRIKKMTDMYNRSNRIGREL
jgi:hypothetical protein